MAVKFIGEVKPVYRVMTGWHSFDHAFQNRKGDLGFPVSTICEVAGPTGAGKSTLIYSLASKIAINLNSNVALVDLETFDPDYMELIMNNAGYDGTVNIISSDKDGEALDELIKVMKGSDYSIGILDSIGAISPIAEEESEMEAANMGRRAKLLATLSRKMIHTERVRAAPTVLFATNHVHSVMGGRGTITSGGVTKDYIMTTRLRIAVKETFEEGGNLLGGKVDKNRFGFGKRPFYLFNLMGFGIHDGLTAVMDCIMCGLAERVRTIKLDGVSHGYLKDLILGYNNPDLFLPFKQALKNSVPLIEKKENIEEE